MNRQNSNIFTLAMFKYVVFFFRTAFEKERKIIGLHYNLEMDFPPQLSLEATELEIRQNTFRK